MKRISVLISAIVLVAILCGCGPPTEEEVAQEKLKQAEKRRVFLCESAHKGGGEIRKGSGCNISCDR